ncbi:uncharacterized protein LOC119375578 isoform X1 [Rhipicephalus sanguineus]|uniref:uncharacterized protein LOC119375578 isoform X1 n=1 Tax=Rhipicephalus sanguineus TaxID=34632 RepID=UPI001895A6A8|nr:uncharacterized protein LOC119375578 isoform X1 [Rhipicephalus sanguineus]
MQGRLPKNELPFRKDLAATPPIAAVFSPPPFFFTHTSYCRTIRGRSPVVGCAIPLGSTNQSNEVDGSFEEKKTSFCARAAAASQNNKLRLCHRHVLPRTTTMQPPRTATVQPLRTTTATPGSPEVAHTSAREADYVTTDGEVHLGKGITIPEGLYSRLMSTKSETRFVREAAVAIYSTAGLVGRSVIGTASNRTKGEAKPPLDKEKYAVLSDFFNHFLKSNFPIGEVEQKKKILNKALANKINDLMKSKD